MTAPDQINATDPPCASGILPLQLIMRDAVAVDKATIAVDGP